MSSFAQFNLDSRIMSAIERIGYKEPTPIQLQAIPVVMKGGDVMGAAQTGTGKTASFGLPLMRTPRCRPPVIPCARSS
jgi:ATP-dependent RNA helicase RhlE